MFELEWIPLNIIHFLLAQLIIKHKVHPLAIYRRHNVMLYNCVCNSGYDTEYEECPKYRWYNDLPQYPQNVQCWRSYSNISLYWKFLFALCGDQFYIFACFISNHHFYFGKEYEVMKLRLNSMANIFVVVYQINCNFLIFCFYIKSTLYNVLFAKKKKKNYYLTSVQFNVNRGKGRNLRSYFYRRIILCLLFVLVCLLLSFIQPSLIQMISC